MGGGMDLLELADRDLRVDLRGGQLRVTQHRLDVTDVRAVLEHQSRHRVTEQVTRAALTEICGLNVSTHELREAVGCKRLAQVGQEERGEDGRIATDR